MRKLSSDDIFSNDISMDNIVTFLSITVYFTWLSSFGGTWAPES